MKDSSLMLLIANKLHLTHYACKNKVMTSIYGNLVTAIS